MQTFGPKKSPTLFRHDLVFLAASLLADNRPAINALAAPVEGIIADLSEERGLLEKAEDTAIIAGAKRGRKDKNVDTRVTRLGGVVRALDKKLYAQLFNRRAPSAINRMPLDDQLLENDRILGELATLPADHPVRVEYEAPLTTDVAELRLSMAADDTAEVALKLARSRMRLFKMRMDTSRVETHGKLQTLLGSRKEADDFFRKPEPREERPEPARPAAPVEAVRSAAPVVEAKPAAPVVEARPIASATSFE